MDSAGSRPGRRARVAPPADGLVLYRRARSSWRSVQSRTAHSRSVSGDEHGQRRSRSSRSSSDHGRSSQGRWSRSREPTPPQLMNFSIDDFTVVPHTTDSFTFTSAHPFFPGWVRVVRAHHQDRVRNTPCAHNLAEEQRAKWRVRRDVEQLELVFASFFSCFHPIFRYKGGGVLGNAWRRHPSRPITPGT